MLLYVEKGLAYVDRQAAQLDSNVMFVSTNVPIRVVLRKELSKRIALIWTVHQNTRYIPAIAQNGKLAGPIPSQPIVTGRRLQHREGLSEYWNYSFWRTIL
jgi:hypothetical protein